MNIRVILSCGVVATALAAAPAAVAAAVAPKPAAPPSHSGDRAAATEMKEATRVINAMKADTHVRDLLKRSKGAFLIPASGRSTTAGGSGEEGLLLAHYHGDWSDPVFYKVGPSGSHAQSGTRGGRIAMILMTDKAINRFKEKNSFSLNTDTALTIVDYSKGGKNSDAGADVVVWSETRVAADAASVRSSNISADEDANRAYYGARYASPVAILSGVSESRPAAAALRHDLPA